MDGAINEFRGEYDFLSNFYVCDITLPGVNGEEITYHSAEAAFQSMKSLDDDERRKFTELTPVQAKRYGKKVKLRPDWEDMKYDIMMAVVFEKFNQNPDIAIKLIETGDRPLIEGNTWHDYYWGVCKGKGQNNLGKILMSTRRVLRHIKENNNDY